MSLDHEDIIEAGKYHRKKSCEQFLCMGLQSWGQSKERIEQAVDGYLESAGFNLERERVIATDWLQGVVADLRRGKFDDEIEQLEAAMILRRTCA